MRKEISHSSPSRLPSSCAAPEDPCLPFVAEHEHGLGVAFWTSAQRHHAEARHQVHYVRDRPNRVTDRPFDLLREGMWLEVDRRPAPIDRRVTLRVFHRWHPFPRVLRD